MQHRPAIATLGLLAFLLAPTSANAQANDGAQPESSLVEQATARTLAGYWTVDRLQSAAPRAVPAVSASEARTKPHQGSSDAETLADVPGAKSPRKLAD